MTSSSTCRRMNLRALKENPDDPTPQSASGRRRTLLVVDRNTAYHLTGKVIVVSLREQTLRAYDTGRWSGGRM